MFCSWKGNSKGGCSCAFRLRKPICEVLNHLCSMGPSTLILRRPGLTVAKQTRFGLHVSSRAKDWTVLHDAISGLQTDLKVDQSAYLIREFPDQCPLLAIASRRCPADLTVRLDRHAWGSRVLQEMIEKFDGIGVDCIRSRQLGAGAWLDEWEQPQVGSPAPESRLSGACEILHRCQLLAVEIQTSSQQCETCFSPSFIDHEGSVIRIADRKRQHVVYADVNAAGFRLDSTADHTAHLFHCS